MEDLFCSVRHGTIHTKSVINECIRVLIVFTDQFINRVSVKLFVPEDLLSCVFSYTMLGLFVPSNHFDIDSICTDQITAHPPAPKSYMCPNVNYIIIMEFMIVFFFFVIQGSIILYLQCEHLLDSAHRMPRHGLWVLNRTVDRFHTS